MQAKTEVLDKLVDAVLLLESKDAPAFVAILPGPTQQMLCYGTKEQIIEALASECWKSAEALEH